MLNSPNKHSEIDPISPIDKLGTVAIVVPYDFVPPTNGGTKVCYDFCISLSQRINLICCSCAQSRRSSSLEIIELFHRSIIKYFDPHLIFKLAHLFRIHHVQTCIINQQFLAISVLIACKMTGRTLVTYAHNLEHRRRDGLRRYIHPLVLLLEFLVFRSSDLIFFISDSERSDAIRLFRLDRNRCFFVPHIAQRHIPYSTSFEKKANIFTILFFGNFSYPPNQHGLQVLLDNIVPLLAERAEFKFRLVIFGKNLPEFVPILPALKTVPIEFLGFVEDTHCHIQAADLMINPVCTGAGVQTKIIDALSLGTTVISARSGVRGIVERACGEKLLTVPDADWDAYVKRIIEVKNNKLYLSPTPRSFLSVYSEEKVMNTVLEALKFLQK